MEKITQIESKYGIFLTLQVLLEHKLINQETFNKIIKVEFKDYPIKGIGGTKYVSYIYA